MDVLVLRSLKVKENVDHKLSLLGYRCSFIAATRQNTEI